MCGIRLKRQFRLLALILASVLIISTFNFPIAKAKQRTIVISNGHAVGYDPGTTSSDLVTEAELNERVAIALMKELDKRGYKVYLTHNSDPQYKDRCLSDCETCDTLRNVGPIVNKVNPDLVCTIHHNSVGNPPSTISGMELYWSSYRDYDTEGVYTDPTLWNNTGGYKDVSPCKDAQDSLRFAEIIFNQFQGFPNMDAPRSINERNDYLPAHAKAPCILYEGGYLSTPSEALFMNSNEYRDEAAKRLADSADIFFNTDNTVTETKTTPDEVNMVVGGQAQLNTVNVPSDSKDYGHSYFSTKPNIATVSGTGLVKGVKEGNSEIIVHPSTDGDIEERIPVNVYPAPDIKVEYEVYTNKGWQKVNNGGLAGSLDTDTPIYGLRAQLYDSNDNAINPNILNLGYRTHIANIGWTNYTATNQVSAAESVQNPIEAVELSLNGEKADQYKLFYRSFIKDHNWTTFVTEGKNSGSEGFGLPTAGLELLVLPANNSRVPSIYGTGFYSKYGDGNFRYVTHVSNVGWNDYTSDSQESGMPESGQAIEAIDFKVSNNLPSGSIASDTHISNIGWIQSETETIGTTGQALSIEAIKLSLTGDLGSLYNINYQVYVRGQGWTQPVSNGAEAGTTGQGLPIESVKIWLTEK